MTLDAHSPSRASMPAWTPTVRRRSLRVHLRQIREIVLTRLWWGWRLYRLGPRTIMRRGLLVNNPDAVAIGSRVTILSQYVLADLQPWTGQRPKIVIGDGCVIQFRFQCNAARSVRIGRNVLIASNVLITDSDHIVEPGGLPATKNGRFVTCPVTIEDNCWLGQNAVILKGVTIGHDSIVGANSVVTRNVPPCSVVGGNPARVIKSLAGNAPAGSDALPVPGGTGGGDVWNG